MVVDIESCVVTEIPDYVLPSYGQFPSVSPHISHILKRSGSAYRARKFHSVAQHTHCAAPVPVENKGQPVIERLQVQSYVKGLDRFPSVVRPHKSRSAYACHRLSVFEPHTALVNFHPGDESVGRYVLIAYGAVGCTYLEVVDIVSHRFHKRLFADSPRPGN